MSISLIKVEVETCMYYPDVECSKIECIQCGTYYKYKMESEDIYKRQNTKVVWKASNKPLTNKDLGGI